MAWVPFRKVWSYCPLLMSASSVSLKFMMGIVLLLFNKNLLCSHSPTEVVNKRIWHVVMFWNGEYWMCLSTSLTFRELFFLCDSLCNRCTEMLSYFVFSFLPTHTHVQPYTGDNDEQTGPLPPNPFSEPSEKELVDYRKRVEGHHLGLDGKTHSICHTQIQTNKLTPCMTPLSFKNSLSC